jgi:hypothetical protein
MLYGDVTSSDALSECLDDLTLPIDGILPRAAGGLSGPITVTMHIGQGGRIISTQFDRGDQLFQKQITQAIAVSKFSAKCADKKLRLVFNFVIEGEPVDNPSVWYTFTSPNRFTLHTHPRSTEVLRTNKPK